MKNISLKSIAAGLMLSASFGVQAQNQMVVELNSGATESYLVPDIRSIKFGATTMIVNLNTAAPVTYNIGDIAQYSFVDVTSTGGAWIGNKNALSIFPNPAADQVDIVYTNTGEERINIELLDATGRQLGQVYSGMHKGKQSYKQQLDIPAGLYFCRITSDGKSLTKPFVVQ